MKTPCAVLAGMFVVAACSPPPPAFDAAAESAKLLKLDAEWADVAAAGKDVEKAASYWSDDAMLMFQGQPIIQGRAAIRKFVSDSFNTPGFKIHWKSEKPVFSPDGRMAWMYGVSETTFPGGPNGALVTAPGRSLTVWRREADGQWRCVVDVGNDPPPAAPAK
jgi:ketosteroid isomerase-like protein